MAETSIERPILFSGAMVRAVRGGRKTQTRRVVKPQPAYGCRYEMNGAGTHALHLSGGITGTDDPLIFVPPTPKSADHRLACPYGVRGDRLWVRETWAPSDGGPSYYAADYEDVCKELGVESWRWRPSIFMPRGASRTTLGVTGVRVERLQAISAGDILREGAVLRPHHDELLGKCPVSAFDGRMYTDLRSLWVAGWDSINGKRPGCSWAENPWVWVVEFEQITEGVSRAQ